MDHMPSAGWNKSNTPRFFPTKDMLVRWNKTWGGIYSRPRCKPAMYACFQGGVDRVHNAGRKNPAPFSGCFMEDRQNKS
jgi:hypothetical protein